LALEMSTRITPKLRFRFDPSLLEGEKINRALRTDRLNRPLPEEDQFEV